MKRALAVCAVGTFCIGVMVSGCPKKVVPATAPNPQMPGPTGYSADSMKAKAGPGASAAKSSSSGGTQSPKAPK